MQSILTYFWQMCRLRAGPEALPATWFALASMLVIYAALAVTTLATSPRDMDGTGISVSILIGVALETTVVLLILAMKGFLYRFIPTMTALFGCNAVILALTLPLNAAFAQGSDSAISFVATFVSIGVFAWWLTIGGFILHRAANISMLQGVGVVLAIEMLAMFTTSSLFPS